MNKALEDRAALQLRWFLKETTTYYETPFSDEIEEELQTVYCFGEFPVENPSIVGGDRYVNKFVYKDSLKFTTSYDWAMLGVNSLSPAQLAKYILKIVGDIGEQLSLDEALEVSALAVITLVAKRKPEQMTLAWVEIKEEEAANVKL